MKSKALRITVTVAWAIASLALIILLAGGTFGGTWMTGWNIKSGVAFNSELIYQESVPSQGVERLEVTAYSESIRVFAVEGGAFDVRHYGDADTLKEELVQISREGGILRVVIPNNNVVRIGIYFHNPRLEIDIPREWFGDASISTSSGSQTLENGFSWRSASLGASSGSVRLTGPLTLEGNASLTASSGSVRIQDLTAASATLKTSSGSLNVEGKLTLTGNLDASASSGSVRLHETWAAQVRAETSSGSLRMGEVWAERVNGKTTSGGLSASKIETASFDLESSSGGVRIDSLTGGGRVKSTSGGISVEALEPTGDVDARASSGSVKLSIPDNCGFNFEARCSSGSIRSDYELYYRDKNSKSAFYTHGEGGPTVNTETTSGSIRLNRR